MEILIKLLVLRNGLYLPVLDNERFWGCIEFRALVGVCEIVDNGFSNLILLMVAFIFEYGETIVSN